MPLRLENHQPPRNSWQRATKGLDPARPAHISRGPLTAVALKDAAQAMDDATLASIIAEGLSAPSMPGYGKTLNEEQKTDLVAFIRAW